MTVTGLAKKALSVEYQLLRTPVDVIAHRAPASSRLREGLERRLASMDAAAGRLLDDDELARRGEETLRDIAQAERTQRRLEAVDRRTELRHERIERQTRNKVERAEAERDKAEANRSAAARRRADAEQLDDMAENVKRQRQRRA